jgi:hypothetical protein
MDNNNNSPGGKICTVCGKWFPSDEFRYGGRDNNTYCQACRNGYAVAYSKGRSEASQKFLRDMRAAWK